MSTNYSEEDDGRLVLASLGGDRAAFGALVKRYQSPIYNFALHFFRSRETAEDVTQETFLRAFRFLHSYDLERRFLTWLYSIARNICIDKHRERQRKEGISIEDLPPEHLRWDKPEGDPLAMLEDREARSILRAAVDRLPEKYKTPLILCYMQGASYQEISDALGISLNNTKIRIFRAKKLLLEYLYGEGE